MTRRLSSGQFFLEAPAEVKAFFRHILGRDISFFFEVIYIEIKCDGDYEMKQITIEAPAKINLTLDVIGKRDDGYHDFETVMHQIDLCDYVKVELIPEGIEVWTDNPALPGGADNLAFKAAQVMKEQLNIKTGFRISIEKNIPLSSGLAGGSTDAAAVMKAINSLLDLEISRKDLNELGLKVGSDVVFCLEGATALAKGRGEILTPIICQAGLELVLVNSGFPVSTARIFDLIDGEKLIHRPDSMLMARAMEEGNLDKIVLALGNVMEQVTIKLYPDLQKIKDDLMEQGARGVMMSGSGPTVFGIISGAEVADQVFQRMLSLYPRTFRASSYRGSEGA
ncbi:MAG: 4-(cytidine 5'-diphospho)-2-C-methyl-D-erythritol kinase [Syntrophomonadaceae bacterium]|nr:4-(cytidine 5'-diphospho)-2-C-methyl-D-erythritol kinase [Syntrophomonadaceae bacterium]